jgi:hypothetical protein
VRPCANADPELVHQMTKVLFENQPKREQTSAAAATVGPAYAMAATAPTGSAGILPPTGTGGFQPPAWGDANSSSERVKDR